MEMRVKSIGLMFFVVTMFIVAELHPAFSASLPVSFFKGEQRGEMQLNKERLTGIIESAFNLEIGKTPYSKVAVNVFYTRKNEPDYMLVHLLDKEIFRFETVRINLVEGYSPETIIRNYIETGADQSADSDTGCRAGCPDETIDIVFYLTDTGFTTSKAALEEVTEKAGQAGYTYVEYYDNQVTTTIYKNWMSCKNLVMLAGFAHGSPNGIMLADGNITTSYFNSLNKEYLNDTVLYTVSCQVFNEPFKSAVLGTGPQKWVGGIENLMAGGCDNVFKSFMNDVLVDKEDMTPTLKKYDNMYPQSGLHGIGGNGPEIIRDPIGQNTLPEADGVQLTSPQDEAVNITLTGSDADKDPITFSIYSQPLHGQLNGTAPTLTYTPNASYYGTDSFVFRVHDGSDFSPEATVDIRITQVPDNNNNNNDGSNNSGGDDDSDGNSGCFLTSVRAFMR